MTGDRAQLPLRMPAELKQRLTEHAKRLGISINAAALVLLDDALTRAERNDR